MAELFQTHSTNNIPIILVDASGSVTLDFKGMQVFDKMKNIIMGLNHEKVRLIFWNSSIPEKEFFKGGIYRLPFVVNRDTINQTFRHVQQKIDGYCLTFPHLAFENIPDDWINDKDMTKIYFITDGQIVGGGSFSVRSLKDSLGRQITRLFEKHNNIQLNIITVEPRVVDLTVKETTLTAAGCDVYEVISNGHLTKFITKFTSYTLNNENGFTHINKNVPPAGFVPYCDKYFSILKVGDFIGYIMGEIEKSQTEDEQLQIVQNLSATLAVLTKDKQRTIVDGIINTFCGLFKNTIIEPLFARMILTESIQKENEGTATIYAAYRSQLKDLFKKADELLVGNAKNALGIGNHFVTYPMYGKIIVGNYRIIDKNISHQGKVYHNGAIEVGKQIVPVIPLQYTSSPMNEQCLRQWTRSIVSRVDNVGAMDDEVIYIVLGNVLRVVLSDVDDEIKNSYRMLGTIMLKKKRLTTDTTELSRLETGELPMDNRGNIDSFNRFMNVVMSKLNIKLPPLTLWYAICLAMNNEQMITRQLIHCADEITATFAGINAKELLIHLKTTEHVPKITVERIRDEMTLDYSCLITMDDTSNVGGYRFLPHQSIAHTQCCPQNVLSEVGYGQLIAQAETSVCPICYVRLNASNFEKVGPKPHAEDVHKIFPDDAKVIFETKQDAPVTYQAVTPQQASEPQQIAPQQATAQQPQQITRTNKLNGNGVIVLMNGTVGSGKSHFSQLLKEHIEKQGGMCIIEGTDKYCRDGMQVKDAIRQITQNMLALNSITDRRRYVIIDTCGEQNKGTTFFNVDASGWKIVKYFPNHIKGELEGYLAWSLRNVLRREMPNTTNTHYLNPISAGVNTCVQVHFKKAKALFQCKVSPMPIVPAAKDDAIKMLDDAANRYASVLENALPIAQEVVKLYDSL